MWLFERLGRHLDTGSLEELTLTTNASQLERHAQGPFNAGVRRINVSIDTLDPAKFEKITRWGKLDKVLGGWMPPPMPVTASINAVVLKDVNDDEIHDMVVCGDRGFDLTFIEVMPMGEIGGDMRLDQYWPLSMVRAELKKRWTLTDIDDTTGGPARYVRVDETKGRIGFITPMTHTLRRLQSSTTDLHRHAVHVPGSGRRRRPKRHCVTATTS